eukprot:5508594-Alexandrium_andersonii.AAC.1
MEALVWEWCVPMCLAPPDQARAAAEGRSPPAPNTIESGRVFPPARPVIRDGERCPSAPDRGHSGSGGLEQLDSDSAVGVGESSWSFLQNAIWNP